MPSVPHRKIANLIPARLTGSHEQPRVRWLDFGTERLHRPFFHHQVDEFIQQHPEETLFDTDLEALASVREDRDAIPLRGFVFHVSRCGSTLVRNILDRSPKIMAIGEPTPLNQILTLKGVDDAARERLLRGAVAALRRRRSGKEEHCVIKLSNWNTLFLPIFRSAFPDIPWLFLYRDPVEVLVSNMGSPRQDWLWREQITGMQTRELAETSSVETCARLVERMCRAAIAEPADRRMIMNYAQLGEKAIPRLLEFFGIRADDRELREMRSELATYSHDRSASFRPDVERKQQQATPRLRELAREYTASTYAALESLRVDI